MLGLNNFYYLHSAFTQKFIKTLYELLVLGRVGVTHVAEKLWRKGGNSWKHTLWSRVYGVAYAKSVGIVETDNCSSNEKSSEQS